MANRMTDRDTVKHLVTSILTRLESRQAILYQADSRENLRKALMDRIGPSIMTEQDLHDQTLERIGGRAGEMVDMEVTESAQYRTARSMVRKEFGDDHLNGFYFLKTLKNIAEDVSKFLMEANDIEDVFEEDSKIEHMVVEIIRKFDPQNLH